MATIDPIKAVLDARNSSTSLSASAGSTQTITVTTESSGNLDGGGPDTQYGGLDVVDGGTN